MTQIEPLLLWVGHAGDGRAFREIIDLGIHAVVQLAVEEPTAVTPRELILCRFPLMDGGDNEPALIHLAITTVARLIEQQVATLVCCGAGMSRSPLITAAALVMLGHGDLMNCVSRIAASRPIDVSPGLWNQVSSFSK